MAQKDKKAPAKKATSSGKDSTKITLKQVSSRETDEPKSEIVKKASVTPTEKQPNVFVRIGGYFIGAWVELRQVHWPNRRSTWGLTLAVLLYSAFFVVLILLLDAFFKYLFEQILK